MKNTVIDLYRNTWQENPRYLIRSPGRVNLIGEHTDYNDGFVFPLAIDYAVWIALSPTRDNSVSLYAGDFKESDVIDLEGFQRKSAGWMEYVKGVAAALQEKKYTLKGWKGVILSDLPIGASLSSSAALEMAVVKAFTQVSGFIIPPLEMAQTGQQAENKWVGVNCGIMDQLASAGGVKDHALFIDCRSLELIPVPLSTDTVVAILDTTTRRKLSASEYNTRREQCETAARVLQRPALRDVTPPMLQNHIHKLDETVGRRAQHVIAENNRVLSTVDCLKHNDMKTVGKLLYQSHESLRDLYEVSSPALDHIVEAAMTSPGCLGARMTGAGFGGCAVALVEKEAVNDFTQQTTRHYRSTAGKEARIYTTSAVGGTELLELD